MTLDQALIASLGIGMLACIALVLRGYIEVRIRFSGFLRSERPELWSQLAPSHNDSEEFVTLGILSFDPTPAISRFRRGGFRELADTELSARCAHANRAERIGLLSWFALLAWTLVVFGVIIALRAA